ncbi:MAG: NAD(P)/FAD-dependent oxidoreductase [Tissierellia bacterium]|nr:NAD(P)/FAD-dependent oxidoreductase [Tissierellia bacterium]
MKKIIVLGAGYGGILTAKRLEKTFRKREDVEVTIIDKNTYHAMLTELHEVAAERVPREAVRIDLDKIFAKRNIEVVHDEILEIDFEQKKLTGKVGEYSYDYLVLATGSKPTFFNTPGADENALTLWTYADSLRINNHIHKMFQLATSELDPDKRKAMLNFVVIGTGFTGVEMVGELAEWKGRLCQTYNIDPDDVGIHVVDMLPKVLPIFDDVLSDKAEAYLKKMGVQIHLSSAITAVNEDSIEMKGREPLLTKTAIWAAGIEGSDLMEGISLEKVARNRVKTDKYLRSLDHEDVFVVGDNIFYVPEGAERPVPQMVENAEISHEVVSHNIASTLDGKEMVEFKPEFHGAMVSIGGRYGVAELNTKNRKFHVSGFPAMFVKHFVNIMYFMKICGINKVWSYLLHEIFHVDDRRSFVGGFFSKRSPNFFLVPLRVFLGIKWLLSGLDKFGNVWEDPNKIFLLPSKMVDATAAASEALEGALSVTPLPVPEFIWKTGDWFMNLFFYNADGSFNALAPVFQTFMVVAEILVGLALIAGLFTLLAGLGSLALSLLIYVSGNAAPEMLWYMVAGLAVMVGSGSTFGLDYWVLPWLSDRWKKLTLVRRWYLFTDRPRGY